MNQKIVISCPHCQKNTMAEVIFYHYEIGKIYERTLACMNCNRPINEKINLGKSEQNANNTVTGQFTFPLFESNQGKETTTNNT